MAGDWLSLRPADAGYDADTSLAAEQGEIPYGAEDFHVPYEPAWASLFATEVTRIRAVLPRDLPLTLEHMGSTAVPGLAAKPILDLLGGYLPDVPVGRIVAALGEAGYVHRGEQGIPGREFFRRGHPRSYHLHLVAEGGTIWREQLAFRDVLRREPALRDAYAALKLELARQFPRDRESYIAGKSAFVRRVVERALQSGGA